jgi:hypothetical protein
MASGIEGVKADLSEMRRTSYPRISFFVRPAIAEWLAEIRREHSPTHETDVLNNAVGAAVLRQVALKNRVQMLSTGDHGKIHELPGFSPTFDVHDEDKYLRGRSFQISNWQDLNWVERTREITCEAVLHDGLMIVGNMANNRDDILSLQGVEVMESRLPMLASDMPRLPEFPA